MMSQNDEEVRGQIVNDKVFYNTYKEFPVKEGETIWTEDCWITVFCPNTSTKIYPGEKNIYIIYNDSEKKYQKYEFGENMVPHKTSLAYCGCIFG